MGYINQIKVGDTTYDINDPRIEEGASLVSGSGVDNVVKLTQAQYDALATKSETTLYCITDSTDSDDDVNYSYAEHVIGTWLDGKPLYEKVVDFNNVRVGINPDNGVAHNIQDVDTIFVQQMFYLSTSSDFYDGRFQNITGGMASATKVFAVSWCANATKFWCLFDSTSWAANAGRTFRAVFRYTKTTDTV